MRWGYHFVVTDDFRIPLLETTSFRWNTKAWILVSAPLLIAYLKDTYVLWTKSSTCKLSYIPRIKVYFLWHFLFSICIYSHSKCTWALFLYSVWQIRIWWRHYSYRILTCSHYFLNTCIYLIIPGHLAMLLYDSEARGGETKSSTEGMYCNKNAVSNSKEIPIYFRYLL